MRTPTPLDRRLAELILAGECFTADDVTQAGALAVDDSHQPNSRQSAIGTVFRDAQRRALITTDGRVVPSQAPHRKGGAIRVWCPTEAGELWARAVLR